MSLLLQNTGDIFALQSKAVTYPVVSPSGSTSDNYADDFSEGLTRSLVGNRIAYFDHDFHQVLPPTYDWGWPFKDGRALVCLGCKVAEVDDEGHRPVIGGKWGFIDKRGREVVSVSLSQAEALTK